MKKLTLLVGLAVLLGASLPAFAVLGPVHVELNMIKPRLSAARANSLTAFKIYIRYNKDIKGGNWVKIWFPIDEQSCDPKDICDGLPKVNGVKEHQRFIPNESYFKQYPESPLKNYGVFYQLKDHKGSAEFLNTPSIYDSILTNLCSTGKCRIIKDNSGLGYFMLGTVFPPLPYDTTERMERIRTIVRSCSFGYSCFCCTTDGYPILINNCHERSFMFIKSGVMEAWRKGYNSIDFNTSKTTGIIGPATPGRYRLAVATEPEPEPVESEAFVLPCSDVSDVEFTDYLPDAADTALSVSFKVGEGGALDGGSSVVNLKFPPGMVFPDKFPLKSIMFNGAFVNTQPKVEKKDDGTVMMLIVPKDVANFGQARIEFLNTSNVTLAPTDKPLTVEVSTTSEPNFIKSKPYSPDVPFATVSPNFEHERTFVACRAILPQGEILKAESVISLNFPQGFILPKTVQPSVVFVNGKAAKKTILEGNVIKITLPQDARFFVRITILRGAGILNPNAGKYLLTVTAPSGNLNCGEVEIRAKNGSLTNLDLSDYQGSMKAKYSFSLYASSQSLIAVGDVFNIVFPKGTVLPMSFDLDDIRINRKPASSAKANGTALEIVSPVEITSTKPADIVINIDIRNPWKHGSYNLLVMIGANEPIVSEEYVIEPAPLRSWIYFKDPDKPNCGDWFNTPPLLGFGCFNPEAKITFWFNNQAEKAMTYNGEARFMPGYQKTTITWMAEFNGVKEEPQTAYINIDTEAPEISFSDYKTKILTNRKSFAIQGQRGFTEFQGDDGKTRYIVTDPVFMRFKGEETKLLIGQTFDATNASLLNLDFAYDIYLDEGENIVELVSRDEACNETTVKQSITLDSIPPEIEVLSPKTGQVFAVGETVQVKIKTEANASVYINGTIASLENVDGDIGYFSYYFDAENGDNPVSIKATDIAGNKSEKTITINAKPKKTIIVLTLEKKEWTVNGMAQTPLKTAPTNMFTDPKHKTLNGTTYMPIVYIANYLNCSIEWNPKEKKMTLNQHLTDGSVKVIECWLNNPITRIDGKEVKYNAKGTLYPVSINGKTMLPLRFIAENLGADVLFDAKTKQITLVYPK